MSVPAALRDDVLLRSRIAQSGGCRAEARQARDIFAMAVGAGGKWGQRILSWSAGRHRWRSTHCERMSWSGNRKSAPSRGGGLLRARVEKQRLPGTPAPTPKAGSVRSRRTLSLWLNLPLQTSGRRPRQFGKPIDLGCLRRAAPRGFWRVEQGDRENHAPEPEGGGGSTAI